MNYLQLVQRLHAEAGLGGAAPSAVTGQTGMNLKLVNWILTAYEDIQNLHPDWNFRKTEFSFSTTATKQNYTKTEAGVADLSSWKTFDVKIYSAVSDESDLEYYPWDDYRIVYKYGSFRTQSNRPTIFSIKPDLSMDLWAIPEAVYTVNGEYFKNIQTLSQNTDVPIIPSDFHMILVWRALMFFGARHGSNMAYSHGQNEYSRLLTRLELNQLPEIVYGEPLA